MRTRKIPCGENFSRSEMFENTKICLGPCQTFMMNIVGKKILRLFGPLKHVYGDYSLKKKDFIKAIHYLYTVILLVFEGVRKSRKESIFSKTRKIHIYQGHMF